VLSAHDLHDGHGLALQALIDQCWNLEDVARQYRDFSATFTPLCGTRDWGRAPGHAFAARTLAVHEWRRIVLQDPLLPHQMLPADWPGHAARTLCGALYWQVFDAAEQFLDSILRRSPAQYEALSPDARRRFGATAGAAGAGAASL
jgi:phenylacetic acid degradation operon negative regulatory protein